MEMGEDGQLLRLEDQLRQKGFQIGSHVKHKTTPDLYEIAGCTDSEVVLEDLPARQMSTKRTLAQFLAHWTHPPAGYESKLLHEDALWQLTGPRTSMGGNAAMAKAEVLKALEIASGLHPDTAQAVQPMLNLKNANAGVVASQNAVAGSIVLVPWTNNIAVDFPADPGFKKTPEWIAEFQFVTSGLPSALSHFATDEPSPRVSICPQSFSEKADEKRKAEEVNETGGGAEQQDPKRARVTGKTKEEEKKLNKPDRGQQKPEEEEEKKKQEEAKKKPEEEEEKKKQEEEKKKQEEAKKKHQRMAVFWRIQGFTASQKKPEDFNMDVGHITVDTWGQIVAQSQNIGAKHAPKPNFAERACLVKTTIPVLTNKKDVLKGDALIYLKRTAPSQDARQVKPISNRHLLVKMLSQEKTEES